MNREKNEMLAEYLVYCILSMIMKLAKYLARSIIQWFVHIRSWSWKYSAQYLLPNSLGNY